MGGCECQHGHAQTEFNDHTKESAYERALCGTQSQMIGLVMQENFG